jgi:uncharacterized protein YdcH (DUF465 family)
LFAEDYINIPELLLDLYLKKQKLQKKDELQTIYSVIGTILTDKFETADKHFETLLKLHEQAHESIADVPRIVRGIQ